MADAAPAIRLIAGLGNPGAQYEQTRHNAGIWWVQLLARKYQASFTPVRAAQGQSAKIEVTGQPVWRFIPDSYVNESGGPLSAVCNYYKIATEETLVAHDDLDLPCGTLRLKFGGSSGGHNGISDVRRAIGDAFWRLKLGIDHPGRASEVISYVLREPDAQQLDAIGEAMGRALNVVEDLATGEFQRPMLHLHTDPSS